MKFTNLAKSVIASISFSLLVSLAVLQPTNLLAKSSAAASSPEERNEVRLLGFDPSANILGGDNQVADFSKAEQAARDSKSVGNQNVDSNTSKTSTPGPLLTEGVFPYELDPVSTVFSAVMALAVMSYKETGKVDINGIMFMLNSTDFYAGVAGSMAAGMGQKTAAKSVGALAGYLKRKSSAENLEPQSLPLPTSGTAFAALGNIVNGISYTLAVSSGFEYFSQFWKIATNNIPEAHRVTDLLHAPAARQKQILLNVLYYAAIDQNMHKRVMASVKYNRIFTFEFLAMNVALYVGYQAGSFVVDHYGLKNPITSYAIKSLASMGAGIAVEFIPDSIKSSANHQLLNSKITWEEAGLADLLTNIEQGIAHSSYISSRQLDDDLESVFATREMLSSLRIQRALTEVNTEREASNLYAPAFMKPILSDYQFVQDSLNRSLTSLQKEKGETVTDRMYRLSKEVDGNFNIQSLSTAENQKFQLSLQKNISILLTAALERIQDEEADAKDLESFLSHSSVEVPVNP